ncbi:MAG: hypothetical protein ACR2GY_01135 [Phycisphaerales bacterium]
MNTHTRHQLPPVTIRTREVLAVSGFLVAGGGLIYTAMLRGAPPSGKIAIAAFTLAAVIMVVGFIGGMIVDRIGVRYPFLVQERFSHTTFFLLVPALTFTLLYGWWHRDVVIDGLRDTTNVVMMEAEEQMTALGVP